MKKKTRRRYPTTAERITVFRTAWQQLAPAESFAGMTLEQFVAKVAPVQECSDRLRNIEAEYAAAQTARRQAEMGAREVLDQVVSSVRGNPNHGRNGELYKALGYVPHQERRSGLARSSQSPAAGEAA